MNWLERMEPYIGRNIELQMEDKGGEDQAAPIQFALYKLELTEEKEHLRFYMNESQFVAVPVFNDKRTQFIQTTFGSYFVSHDERAKLIYRIYV